MTFFVYRIGQVRKTKLSEKLTADRKNAFSAIFVSQLIESPYEILRNNLKFVDFILSSGGIATAKFFASTRFAGYM